MIIKKKKLNKHITFKITDLTDGEVCYMLLLKVGMYKTTWLYDEFIFKQRI